MEENNKIIENRQDNNNTDRNKSMKNNQEKRIIEEFISEYNQYNIEKHTFLLGITNINNIAVECQKDNKYYQEKLSKEEISNLNDALEIYTIQSIYKLISNSLKQKKLNISTTKRNNIKLNLFLIDDNNDIHLEILLTEIPKQKLFKKKPINQENNKKNENDLLFIENNGDEEFEEEEDENENMVFLDDDSENNNQEEKDNFNLFNDTDKQKRLSRSMNITNENASNMYKIYNIINKLKNDIIYLKNFNDSKNDELNNNNNEIIEVLKEMQNKINFLNEENKKNKEEISLLKTMINTISITPGNEKNNSNFKISNNNQISIINNNEEEKSSKIKKLKIKKRRQKSDDILNSSRSNKLDEMQLNINKSNNNNFKLNNQQPNEEAIVSYLFKEKYKINEDDEEIDFTNEKLGDEGIEILSQISFNNLQKLSLDTNDIFEIKPLTNMDLSLLLVLNLDNNCISDINIFDKMKCNNLQTLWLNNNNIKDIDVFERAKLSKLQSLYLNNNKIEDITVFQRAKLGMLEKLYLRNNCISDISCLENISLNKIQLIFLNKNKVDYNSQVNKELVKRLKNKIKYFSY